ncbi:hypothetical protein [Streptomyces sp. NPDC048639]|uniref:hypothetical protein n=1 Tax=Streptomyces sp. NPDC048639 TaxID=3365581 RepID=UPI00371E99A8
MAERDAGPGRDEDGREPLDEDAAWAAIVAAYGEEPPDLDSSPDSGGDAGRTGARSSVKEGAGAGSSASGRSDADTGDSGPDRTGRASGASTDAGTDRDGDADGDSEDAGTPAGTGAGKETGETGDAAGPGTDRPLGSSVTIHPAIGPRDWSAVEPSDDDPDGSDEGHFVPPEPPPLPEADTTAKFAWLAVTGGPLLLLLAVLLQWNMTWWITTLGVGGFIGGFATLVIRMGDSDEDDDDDPGRGAVV